jgi:hypothetical protein
MVHPRSSRHRPLFSSVPSVLLMARSDLATASQPTQGLGREHDIPSIPPMVSVVTVLVITYTIS